MKQVKRMVLSVVLVFLVALGIWTFHDVQASDSESMQDNLAGMPTTWAANVGANKIDDHEYKVNPFSADVAIEFLNGDNQYPDAPEGYLFAGWYTNELCDDTCMLKGATPTDTVYALFVPEDVLSIKAQISTNLLDSDSTNDETGAIRFVTTVDSLRYKEVGFELSYVDSNDVTRRAVSKSNKVYSRLIEMIGTAVSTARPESTFCGLSQYFKACTIQNLPISDFKDIKFKVEPYWITMDGDKVYGVSAERSIQDGCDFLGAVDAKIAGHKYGVTGNSLADGTEITLAKKDSDVTKTAQITNGKISKTELEVGTWTVQADGYIPIEILVSEGTYSKDIVLEYELFTNYLKEELDWTDYADLSNMNDGTVTQAFGGSMFLVSKDSYDSVAISLNLSTTGLTGGRHGTFVKFGNDCVFIQVEPKSDGDYKLTWNAFDAFGSQNSWIPEAPLKNITSSWTEQADPLSDEQIAGLNDGSLYFTLVREGNEILAYIDGQYCNKLTLDAATYADMECQVGIYGMQIKEGMVRNFKIATTGSIGAKISGHKYGVTGNSLKDGTEITLTSPDGSTTKTATVKDGKISVDGLDAGVWTMTAENYVPQGITIVTGITHSEEIVLEYELFTNFFEGTSYPHQADLSKMNDGTVAPKDTTQLFLLSNESYDSVAISLNLKATGLTGGRHGTLVKFGNDCVFIQLEKESGGNYKISWNAFDAFGSSSGWIKNTELKNITTSWEEQVSSLSTEQIDGFDNGTLDFTLVRKGNEIYAFVGDEYCNKLTLDAATYADMECQVGIYGQHTVAGHAYNFEIEDGESYLSNNDTIGFVDAKITGHKYGVTGSNLSDGTEVTFTLDGTTEKATIKDGKICLNGLKAGTWTVKADGYVPTEVVIEGGTYSKEIVLEYELFTNYFEEIGYSSYTADLSEMNDGIVKPNATQMILLSKDSYDSVAISLNLKAEGLTTGRHGTLVKFGNNCVFIQLEPQSGGKYQITWNGFGPSDWRSEIKLQNLALNKWTALQSPLSDAQKAGLNDGSLYFTLVREGNRILTYLDGKYCNELTLDETYTDMDCQVGIYGMNTLADHAFNFKIEDGTSYLQSHPVTGTTVASQTTGYKLKMWLQRTANSLNNVGL